MLVLVGSGEYLPDVDAIDRTIMARLTEPARVVCLPTAAGREGNEKIQSWMQMGIDHYTRLGAEVTALPIIDNETAHNAEYVQTITNANFVYMSGGNPGHLHESLYGTAVWNAIIGVHKQGGIVAGCSAGAMIMGEQIVGPGGRRDGFNLLPETVIIPHFDEYPGLFNRIARLVSNRSLTMVGIDGRTALVVDENSSGRHEVLGKSHVSLITSEGTTKYGAGVLPEGLL